MFSRAFVPAVCSLLVLSVLLVPTPARASEGYLAGISVYGQDDDGNGRIDVVLILVSVAVYTPGPFVLSVQLLGAPEPQTRTVNLPIGTTVVPVAFSGAAFRALGTDGPYPFMVDLYDASGRILLSSNAAATPAWTASDFDPAGAVVASLQTPWFRDTDGSGLVDTMQLNYTLAVTVAGTYRLRAQVANETGDVLVAGWDRVTVAAGSVSGHVSLDVRPVAAAGIDGVLNVTLTLFATLGLQDVAVSSASVLTPAVASAGFDTAWARFLPGVTDEGRDTNGDGLLEAIVVHAPVHLDRPATVTVSGNISTGPDWYQAVDGASLPTALPAGDAVVDVVYGATWILWNANGDGPYMGNLTLTVAGLPEYADHETFTTAPYAYADLADTAGRSDPTKWTYILVDTDYDGLAEWLDVAVTLTASRAGDYFLETAMYTWEGGALPYVSQAQYVHLEPGTRYVTVRFPGIAGNRMVVNDIDSSFERLDSSEPLGGWGFGWGPGLNPAVFHGRPVAYLNGTVATTTGVPAAAVVIAADPMNGFSLSAQTSNAGHYSLPLYDGSFSVLAQSLEDPRASVVETATLSGDTPQNFTLPASTFAASYDATLAAWNTAALDTTLDFGTASAAARFYADLFGNFDGYADANELGFYARYPANPLLPGRFPSATSLAAADGLTLRVDGRELAPGSAQVASVTGAGPVASSDPVSVTLTYALQGPAIPAAGSHIVSVAVPPETRSASDVVHLSLPAAAAWSAGNASQDAVLTQSGPGAWTLDPQSPVELGAMASSAWIRTWDRDPIAPSAAATGPAQVERGLPATFRSAGSTDNVGIVNTTWTVRANGTTVHGYAEAFTWAPTQIGTFDVGVRVRDAGGNFDDANVTLVVVDTTPPSAPSGLTADAASKGGSPVVYLTWSPVSADDLAAYRVYRSADNGATFQLLGTTGGTRAAYADNATSAGTTYVYRVTALDRYGNEGSPSVTAQAVVPASGGTAAASDLGLGIAIGAGIVGVAAAVAVVLLLRRLKKAQPPGEAPPKP